VRAIRRCTPLKLPADMYESWKELEITFDPHMMSPRDVDSSVKNKNQLEELRKALEGRKPM
jgi:hypothetical protein